MRCLRFVDELYLSGISCSLPGGLNEALLPVLRRKPKTQKDTGRSAFMTQDHSGLGITRAGIEIVERCPFSVLSKIRHL